MADASFDVVSKVDRQEVDNALNQAAKEVGQRFDFRGTNASIAWSGELGVTIKADTEERAKAALEVFKEKLVKRSISLKSLDAGDPKQSGKQYVIPATLKQGLDSDHARKILAGHDEGPRVCRPRSGRPAPSAARKGRSQVIVLLTTRTSMSPCNSSTIAGPRHRS
jgi:uncharacterized protein YajQ (UPF0234 family)